MAETELRTLIVTRPGLSAMSAAERQAIAQEAAEEHCRRTGEGLISNVLTLGVIRRVVTDDGIHAESIDVEFEVIPRES